MADDYLDGRERVAGTYAFTIRRRDKTILTTLTTLKLSLWLKGSAGPTYINGRQEQDVLGGGGGQNNVTFAAGVVTWSIQPADTQLSGEAAEVHVALFQWTGGGGEADFHEVEIAIPNVRAR